MTWPISRRRKFRKALVAIFGRRRPTRQAPPRRKYYRVSCVELLLIRNRAARGWSARKIARKLQRDHHTVLRALKVIGDGANRIQR
jgi:hypothetical protein